MSSKARNKKRDKDDDDDGVFDDDSDEDVESDEEVSSKPAVKKRKMKSFIDDAAEESGDENGDDDEDEDDDDDNNDYIKDGFVVDEEEDDVVARKKKDDLEDSDEDSDDDDEGEARLKKVRKMRTTDRLDDDDLALIKEAQGDVDDDLPDMDEVVEKPRERVVATTEAELRKGLFYDSGEEEQVVKNKSQKQRKPTRVERYDEDGMDDFIEDDIGDQEAIRMSDRKTYDEDAREINEAQLNEASEIFGTDYLEFMQDDVDEDEEELLGKNKFKERGVGVSYEIDSEEEILSGEDDDDDDDDLFGDEDDDARDESKAKQKTEALRLRREKRKLVKAERRRQAQLKKSERRKAQLRRAFEPVQLVENFCTERDDEIRQADLPERFYDWKVPFYGSEKDGMTDHEEAQASWIARQIPDIAMEMAAAEESEDKQRLILTSIVNALRFMHRDKLEPAFIKRYRKDYVISTIVQNNLESIIDEDSEWDRMLAARAKVEGLLESITKSATADESVGADANKLIALQEELADAQKKFDETAKQESQVQAELTALGSGDDDDDELFGDDDDDDDEVRPFCLSLLF